MRSLLMQKKLGKLFFQFYGEMKEFFPENAVEYFVSVDVNGVNSKFDKWKILIEKQV